jgi:hydrogenase/urease accessory protein HupE
LLALALWPAAARAHSTTFAVYSKYEATTSGRSIAFVFALDKASVLALLERDAAHAKVAPEAAVEYRGFFSQYLFQRFTVSNAGAACTHPDQLGRFFWDEPTKRMVAVTRFVCPNDLSQLTIRSLVTHDMPIPHEMVGDLQHGRSLERSFFHGDEVEARIDLSALPPPGVEVRDTRKRARFSYAAVPDKERRYQSLAEGELGVPLDGGTAHAPFWRTLRHFIGQGVLHIFTGYDHVLFIVTLLFGVGSWRRLAMIVTSFTAAHSITLAVSTLGLVTVPSRIIEPLIAVTVLAVAVDAVLRPQKSARIAVTFAFGLIHGFGLSNVLRALGLQGRELVPALLGFNLGVELGQLAIVTPLFPLVLLLRSRQPIYARARNVLCGGVAVVAVFWIVMRVTEAFTG